MASPTPTIELYDTHNSIDKESTLNHANSFVPSGVLKAESILELLGHVNIASTPPDSSSLPRAKSIEMYVEVGNSLACATLPPTPPPDEWTSEKPFTATVKRARWLTSYQPEEVPSSSPGHQSGEKAASWGESKRVVHLEIALGNRRCHHAQIGFL